MTIMGTHHCDGPDKDSRYWEEAGTLWLWAWPDLVWEEDLIWLLSPVSSEPPPYGYGDLWGVDQNGQLIIVETKRRIGRSAFSKFEEFEENLPDNPIDPDDLHLEWREKLKQEEEFVLDLPHFKEPGSQRPQRPYPGVVPYSNRRAVVLRWHILYERKIIPLLKSKSRYRDKVSAYLAKVKRPNKPVFVGLGVVSPADKLEFTQYEESQYENLKGTLSDRIKGVVVRGRPLGNNPRRWVIQSATR